MRTYNKQPHILSHDYCSEYMSLAEVAIFEYAFKQGMQIVFETLTGEDYPRRRTFIEINL